jgi:serine/threonine-protein kinase
MILVRIAALTEVEAEGLIRSVSAELDPITSVSRDLEKGAGQAVTDRLRAMGVLPVGAAVITPGGELGVPFLIHVVLQSSEEPIVKEGVRLALQNGLRRAREWGLETLAVPVLGIGAGNLSVEESAEAMVPLIQEHVRVFESPREVVVAVSNEYEEEIFSRAVELARRKASALEN